MKFPYMTTRKGSRNWYFKRDIPASLQDAYKGKKQIWISLRTPDKSEAMQVYHKIADDVESQFEAARLGSPTGSAYNIAKRARLKKYHAAKNDAFKYAVETGADVWLDPWINTTEELVSHTEDGLAGQRIKELEEKKRLGAIDVRHADAEIEALQHLIAGTVPKNEPETSTLPYLLKVLPDYYEEFKTTVSRPTYRKKKPHVELFIKWIKSKPIDQYSLKDGNAFLERLKKKQAVGKPKGQMLGPNATNAYLISVTQLFDWLQKRYGDAVANPAKTIRVPEKKPINTAKPRTSFTTEELNKLFQVVRRDHPLFWTVMIPLYSSMRVQATCQLRKCDIQKRDGVFFFDVHARGENKLKNLGATREIPVHNRLIELDLFDFAKTMDDYFFPSVPEGNRLYSSGHDRWADSLGTAFAKLLKEAKIKRDELTFTSLRHSHVDASRESGMIPEREIIDR